MTSAMIMWKRVVDRAVARRPWRARRRARRAACRRRAGPRSRRSWSCRPRRRRGCRSRTCRTAKVPPNGQLHVGVRVDAAGDDVLARGVDRPCRRSAVTVAPSPWWRPSGDDPLASISTSAWSSSAAVTTSPLRMSVGSCVASATSSIGLRRAMLEPLGRLGAVSAQRWRDAQHVAVAGRPCRSSRPRRFAASSTRAAGRPRLAGRAERASSLPGRTSSTPIIRPLPRTSPTNGCRSPSRAQRVDPAGRPTLRRVALQVVVEQVVEVGSAPADGERGAAERGDASWPARQSITSARATTPPMRQPVADALGEGEDVGRSDRRAPGSPRSGRRCGPSRSAPRRR